MVFFVFFNENDHLKGQGSIVLFTFWHKVQGMMPRVATCRSKVGHWDPELAIGSDWERWEASKAGFGRLL